MNRYCLGWTVGLLVTATLFAWPSQAAAQGVLGGLTEEVAHGTQTAKKKKKKKDKPPEQQQHSGWHWDDDHYYHHDDDDHYNPWSLGIGAVIAPVIWYGLTSPFWVPPQAVQDDGEPHYTFKAYPYQADSPGYMQHELHGQPVRTVYPWTLRLSGEYADEFDAVRRAGVRALFETQSRLGIDASLDYFWEPHVAAGTNDLWLGDANVVFRFAQSDRLSMRAGLGMNYLTGYGSTDFGFNFTYGGDWFPRRPWIVSADLDVGTLGKVGFFRGRATVGVNIRKVEFYTGYEYLDVGTTQIGTVLGGIRLWY